MMCVFHVIACCHRKSLSMRAPVKRSTHTKTWEKTAIQHRKSAIWTTTFQALDINFESCSLATFFFPCYYCCCRCFIWAFWRVDHCYATWKLHMVIVFCERRSSNRQRDSESAEPNAEKMRFNVIMRLPAMSNSFHITGFIADNTTKSGKKTRGELIRTTQINGWPEEKKLTHFSWTVQQKARVWCDCVFTMYRLRVSTHCGNIDPQKPNKISICAWKISSKIIAIAQSVGARLVSGNFVEMKITKKNRERQKRNNKKAH